MAPMRVKESLRMNNVFNYSFRKFDLRSKDYVDRFLPTDLSVANLMYEKSQAKLDSIVAS